MKVEIGKIGSAIVLAAALGGCAGVSKGLQPAVNSGSGPDEFQVLPGKPLQTPPDYTSLPAPTPGGGNLTDPDPKAEAVAALGGNAGAFERSGPPAADRALLSHAARYGVPPDIRTQLAAQDSAFRRRGGGLFFLRWFSRNRYFSAYRQFALDAYAELERLRAAGVKTPSAPPRP